MSLITNSYIKSGGTKKYDPKNVPFDNYITESDLKRMIPIFKDFEFKINTDEEGNGGFQVSQFQMVFLEMIESVTQQYEMFHGQFILTGLEYGSKYEVHIQEPYRMQITLQYPKGLVKDKNEINKRFDQQEDINSIAKYKIEKTDNPPWNTTDQITIDVPTEEKKNTYEVDQRKYIIEIFKYVRREEYVNKNYPEMGERVSIPSHSYFEFWGVPDYQQKLMKSNILAKSFKKEDYGEIMKKLQSDELGVKEQDDFCNGQIQNKPDQNNPFIIPQGLPLSTVFENLRQKQWCTDQIDKPSPPVWFLNNQRLTFKFPTQIRSDILDIWVGNMFQTQVLTGQTFEDQMKELKSESWNTEDENPRQPFSESKLHENNVGKVVFNGFKYIQKSRSQLMGIYQKRNTKHILEGIEQEGQSPVPLKHKQTNWFNLINPEPYFEEIHEGEHYNEKYEYDQYFLDHEYSLEDRMGKKYWKQLLNSFKNMDLLTVTQNNATHHNLLETMRLGLIVRQHFKDSNLIGNINIMHNEDQQFIVHQRVHLMYPQRNIWRMEIGLGTDQKWQMYNEDPHGTFFCSVCKQFKQIRSYSFDGVQEQGQIDPSKYEIVPFQYKERDRQDIERRING